MILAPSDENIRQAAVLLGRGELVAFPTETVYGLGADATNEEAVRLIFAAKGRPAFNPLIVHISGIDKLDAVVRLDSGSALQRMVERLAEKFWPGPLSLVLPKQPTIAPSVCAGLETVAVRVPAHPIARKLLLACGCPIAAPSANPSFYVSPTTAQHVVDGLGDKIPVLDGGACSVGVESTVLAFDGVRPMILRPGGVPAEEIGAVLGLSPRELLANSEASLLASPGMLPHHYSPATPVKLSSAIAAADFPPKVGLISFSDRAEAQFDYMHITRLTRDNNLAEAAQQLYAALRDMDKRGLDLIVVDSCGEEGLGLAIMDRIRKAAAKFSAE